jgi:pimeloyl-ACP methyl ester carboxylesterase
MIYHFHQTPIFYEITGSGSAMVLLHGFLESSTMWKDIAPELSEKKQIITIDLPGHGKSGCIDDIHTMELMGSVVSSLLKSIGCEEYDLIGHSMGGYVALAMAEADPKSIKSLTLLNSTSRRDSNDRKANRDRALRFMNEEKNTIISMAIANLFTAENRIRFASEIEQLKKEALLFPSAGITAAIKGMRDRTDRTHVLKNLTNAKLLIAGNSDPIVPVDISEEIATITNTRLTILEGGHMSWIENRAEIVKIVHFIE